MDVLSYLPFSPHTISAAQQGNPVDPYKPHGYVNDFAGMIDSVAQSRLNLICKDLDEKKRTQMAIVTVPSLDGLSAKEFATQMANK